MEVNDDLMQKQFKAVARLVETIENLTKTLCEQGGKGLPVDKFQSLVKTIRLNERGCAILGDLLNASDVLKVSECGGYLVVREVSQLVIDAECVEVN